MRPRDIKTDLTGEKLRQLFRYSATTGKFVRLVSNNQHAIGEEAGCVENSGYRRITVGGRRYVAHRLAWLYVTDKWPKDRIDHKNLDKDDNRWENLREATDFQNKVNSRVPKTNKLQIKGVRLHETGRYQARLSISNGRYKHLGLFDTKEEAMAVYARAAIKRNGEFARTS